MKTGVLIERAEKHRLQMEKALVPINRALAALLEDANAQVLHQPSDGWVILFNDDNIAYFMNDELDSLLSMSREEALRFLHSRLI